MAFRPALSADGNRVHLDECGQTSRVRSLRAENARLRQEVEYLRAEVAQLGQENAEMATVVKKAGQWVQSHREFPQELGRAAVDVRGELLVARGAVQAVLALHQDASGYCPHCRRPRRCPTVAAIEAARQQAREELRHSGW